MMYTYMKKKKKKKNIPLKNCSISRTVRYIARHRNRFISSEILLEAGPSLVPPSRFHRKPRTSRKKRISIIERLLSWQASLQRHRWALHSTGVRASGDDGLSSSEDYVSATQRFSTTNLTKAYTYGSEWQESFLLDRFSPARKRFPVVCRRCPPLGKRGLRDIFVIRPNRYVPSGREARDDVSMEAVTAEEST